MKAANGPVIFFVTHSSAGGAQEIWANLAEGFAARGHEVRLMALYPLRSTVRTTSEGLPWRYLVERRPRGLREAIALMRGIVRLMREERPGIVFTAMPAANVALAIGAWLAGRRSSVVTSHHSPADTHNRVLDAVDSLSGSLGSVRAVVSVSDAVATSLARKPAAYRSKGRTITNALPPRIEALLVDLARARAARPAGQRRIVATGRLAAQKNYPVLIRAMALIEDATLDIVGDGPDEKMLRTLAVEMGVEQRIRFWGYLPREKALAILALGDVFAQISLFEGHSLGLLEAAKLGMPLVVSDVAVQIEGITSRDGTRCGLAVGVSDVEGVAQQFRRLLDDQEEYAHWSALSSRLGGEATYGAMLSAYEALAE